MEMADILVTIDLAGYTATSYSAGDAIADKGYAGAEKKSALLARLALSPCGWNPIPGPALSC